MKQKIFTATKEYDYKKKLGAHFAKKAFRIFVYFQLTLICVSTILTRFFVKGKLAHETCSY